MEIFELPAKQQTFRVLCLNYFFLVNNFALLVMVDVCPAPNVTVNSTKWDKQEVGFVLDVCVASDILFIVSVTVLYLYCATRSKKKVPHLEPPVIVGIGETLPTTANKYSIISFRRSSCPPLFT